MTRPSKICLATTLLTLALGSLAAQAAPRLDAVREDGTPGTIVLVEERLQVTVDRQYLDATLRQIYQNEDDARLEGRYRLQVGDGASVHGFAYWNGEDKIVGEVFEKDVATEVYQEITGLGRDPGLLEQEGEGSFSFRVFPIEPGERKPVEVDIGTYLQRSGKTVHLRLPVASDRASIDIDLRDERGLSNIRSDSHEVSTRHRPDGTWVVHAERRKGSGDLFELDYDVAVAPWTLAATVHRDPGLDGYTWLTLATPQSVPDTTISAKDVTLVLDRSGSMSGDPLAQARVAAKEVIARLRPEDRVNVVAFDDGVETLYGQPKRVTPDVRKQAIDYVERIDEGGGTDIAQALQRALANQLDDDQPDVVLFLTDGQSDSQTALDAAKNARADARVFTIGVGSGVARPLLSRLASQRRGFFTYIESASAITSTMSKLYSQIESPLMVDLELEVEGATLVRTYPRRLPDLFVGDELRVAARLRGDGPATVTLLGRRDGKPVRFEAHLDVADTRRPWVGRLWAEARVDDLLEEVALHGPTPELTDEAIELALAYDLVTPYTSFLAIPENELTSHASESLAAARARKQQILAANPDAVALSRSAMPPGDPILTVRAPSNATQVTAYFPFGLVKDMVWDADLEMWSTRFLVPNHVIDGEYDVRVVIVEADGTVRVGTASYTIDSEAEPVSVELEHRADGIHVTVVSTEPLREVTVSPMGAPDDRVRLRSDGDRRVFRGQLPTSIGTRELRVVAADLARNEVEVIADLGAVR